MKRLLGIMAIIAMLAIPLGVHLEFIPWGATFADEVVVYDVRDVRVEVSRRLFDYLGDPRPETWPADLRGSVAIGLSHAEAGTITLNFGAPQTLTTTAPQDAALQRLVARSNADRAGQVPPLPARTIEQYLRDVLITAVGSYFLQAKEAEGEDFCIAWKAKTPAERAAVVTAHGGNEPPCP
jgi:hypothetical protein